MSESLPNNQNSNSFGRDTPQIINRENKFNNTSNAVSVPDIQTETEMSFDAINNANQMMVSPAKNQSPYQNREAQPDTSLHGESERSSPQTRKRSKKLELKKQALQSRQHTRATAAALIKVENEQTDRTVTDSGK